MTQTKINDLIKFALKLLSVRDYFSCELVNKLKKKEESQEKIKDVMIYLNEYNYLKDEETLRKYALELSEKSRGINYLKKKLFEKGCGELFSDNMISKIYSRDMEKDAAERLAKSMSGYSVKKIVGRLKSRGFRTDVIYEIYEGLK